MAAFGLFVLQMLFERFCCKVEELDELAEFVDEVEEEEAFRFLLMPPIPA